MFRCRCPFQSSVWKTEQRGAWRLCGIAESKKVVLSFVDFPLHCTQSNATGFAIWLHHASRCIAILDNQTFQRIPLAKMTKVNFQSENCIWLFLVPYAMQTSIRTSVCFHVIRNISGLRLDKSDGRLKSCETALKRGVFLWLKMQEIDCYCMYKNTQAAF